MTLLLLLLTMTGQGETSFMLEVGKTYKTKTGKTVQIISDNDRSVGSCEALEALVDMGHMKHWTMYSRDGKCYEGPIFDIETETDPAHFSEVIQEFISRPGISISVLDAFKEGLDKGYRVAIEAMNSIRI